MANRINYKFQCVRDDGTKYDFHEWVWCNADAVAIANSYEQVTGDRVYYYAPDVGGRSDANEE